MRALCEHRSRNEGWHPQNTWRINRVVRPHVKAEQVLATKAGCNGLSELAHGHGCAGADIDRPRHLPKNRRRDLPAGNGDVQEVTDLASARAALPARRQPVGLARTEQDGASLRPRRMIEQTAPSERSTRLWKGLRKREKRPRLCTGQYGVTGRKGVLMDSTPAVRSYSKQVPTPTNRLTPASKAPCAKARVPDRHVQVQRREQILSRLGIPEPHARQRQCSRRPSPRNSGTLGEHVRRCHCLARALGRSLPGSDHGSHLRASLGQGAQHLAPHEPRRASQRTCHVTRSSGTAVTNRVPEAASGASWAPLLPRYSMAGYHIVRPVCQCRSAAGQECGCPGGSCPALQDPRRTRRARVRFHAGIVQQRVALRRGPIPRDGLAFAPLRRAGNSTNPSFTSSALGWKAR